MLFEVGGIAGFLLLALWIWALVDCISSDAKMVRNLPKFGWLVIVILLLDIGAVLWLLLGRPLNKHWRPTVYGETATPHQEPGVEDRVHDVGAITDRRSAELDRRLAAVGTAAGDSNSGDELHRTSADPDDE